MFDVYRHLMGEELGSLTLKEHSLTNPSLAASLAFSIIVYDDAAGHVFPENREQEWMRALAFFAALSEDDLLGASKNTVADDHWSQTRKIRGPRHYEVICDRESGSISREKKPKDADPEMEQKFKATMILATVSCGAMVRYT
nr:hypothetical protein [Tanacetum cinerariifolium]